MTQIQDIRRKRILFRAGHRGMKEMDLILDAFAHAELAGLDDTELSQFERLLDVADDTLYEWITGRSTVAHEHNTNLLARIKALCLTGIASRSTPRTCQSRTP